MQMARVEMKAKQLMKTWLAVLVFLLITGSISTACDIEFKVIGDEKETYNIGDEIVVLLEVTYTDRDCPEGIDATQYKTDGLKISAATKWKETSPDIWKRKLKLLVEGNQEGTPKIAAIRTCEKEGGFGEMTCGASQIEENAVAR